jgi:hypothetical protein
MAGSIQCRGRKTYRGACEAETRRRELERVFMAPQESRPVTEGRMSKRWSTPPPQT